jgi:rhodanese-related sulfurtransferase
MINRSLAKFLSYRYQILAVVFILLAGGLVLLPKYEKHEGISPEELLSDAASPERYISTDDLADRIINQDPSLMLVDVRDEASYKQYTIPGAVNIPLEKLLDEESDPYINQNAYDIVFFSNDSFYADQAWMLCKRKNYKNLNVLKGGINQWYNTIINPEKPTENMPATAYDIYSARKAASMYFGVAYPEKIVVKSSPVKKKVTKTAPANTTSTPKKVVPVKKKKKAPIEGGC